MVADITPYSTVASLLKGEALWIPELDRERIESYTTYDSIYWNVPDTFSLVQRGTDSPPIYIPNARTVCDVTAHYVLKGLMVQPEDPEAMKDMADALKAFLKRERFYSKFSTAKHSGVVKGDFILHITADELLPQGRRISINSLDPATYFPVYDDDDLDKRIAVHLVEQIVDPRDPKKFVLKKQTYRSIAVDSRLRVTSEAGLFELDDWDGPESEPFEVLIPEMLLPEDIDVIPVYHFKNMDWQSQPFGSSELRGFERLLAGINQSITDEDIALALEGLGVYTTDSGKPVDDDGNEREWEIAPGHVIELAGTYFKRVEGVSSVTPFLDHVRYLEKSLWEATATTEVARGIIDAGTAESGIALAIKFLPTLAKVEQRDTNGSEKLMNLFFDWKKWHKAFEGQDFTATGDILAAIGEKLPMNRTAILNELNNMMDRKVISAQYYRSEMQKLGYVFPDDMDAQIEKEQKALAETMVDPFAARVESEANNSERTNESNGTEAE